MQNDDDRLKTGTADLAGLLPSGRSSRQHVYVVVLAGLKAGAVFRLGDRATTLGRSPSCDITLPDDGVSRVHAKLTRTGAHQVTLSDQGSTNGSFIGGQRVSQEKLRDGDRFELAGTLLKVYFGDELEATLQQSLYESSMRDGLTNLYNRRYLEERLNAEFSFAKRHDTSLAFILFDLDHFKRINDTYGHATGDDTLRDVAEGLQNTTRAEDVVARFGGEEFAVLARQTSMLQALRLAERVRAVVGHIRVQNPGREDVHITMSAGVACLNPGQYDTCERLVTAADEALYRAKERGRNCVSLAEDQSTAGDAKTTQKPGKIR